MVRKGETVHSESSETHSRSTVNTWYSKTELASQNLVGYVKAAIEIIDFKVKL